MLPPGAIQAGYSLQPLQRAVFDPARVVVEGTAFDNWLSQNYTTLTAESMKGPREHLYYLIDSYAKMIYARDGVVLPRQPDAFLALLLSWSPRLGVFGGDLVYDAIKPDRFEALPAVMPVPQGFTLALEGDLLVVSSEGGHWSVAVPYYFMIWNIREFDAAHGPRTQLVAFSTGAAMHEGQPGWSQATLMLLSGPDAAGEDFASFWSAHLGFSGAEPLEPLGVGSLLSRQRYDEAANMYLEYTSWQTAHGPMLVAYLGINGTYQWNRPHFLDFLQAVRAE